MDDLFIIFVALAAVLAWCAGYWFHKHDAARALAELEATLKEAHALDRKTLIATLAQSMADTRIAQNQLQAILEARKAKKEAA